MVTLWRGTKHATFFTEVILFLKSKNFRYIYGFLDQNLENWCEYMKHIYHQKVEGLTSAGDRHFASLVYVAFHCVVENLFRRTYKLHVLNSARRCLEKNCISFWRKLNIYTCRKDLSVMVRSFQTYLMTTKLGNGNEISKKWFSGSGPEDVILLCRLAVLRKMALRTRLTP